MILIEADWARPWLPGVLASDASLSGFVVAQSFWIVSDVAAVCHTFVSAGFRVGSCSAEVLRDCLGRPISLDPELAEIIASERWETDSSFPEVPSHLALEPFMEEGHG